MSASMKSVFSSWARGLRVSRPATYSTSGSASRRRASSVPRWLAIPVMRMRRPGTGSGANPPSRRARRGLFVWGPSSARRLARALPGGGRLLRLGCRAGGLAGGGGFAGGGGLAGGGRLRARRRLLRLGRALRTGGFGDAGSGGGAAAGGGGPGGAALRQALLDRRQAAAERAQLRLQLADVLVRRRPRRVD